jgi:hypothetical protein
MERTGRPSGTYLLFQAVEANPLRAYITVESEGRTRLALPTEGGPRQVHGALQSRLHVYHGAYQSEMEQDTRCPAVGEEITTFFCKTREITSLCTSPRRQPCLLRAGAHWHGLLDVAETRTSLLHHPQSHRLATPFSLILQKISVLFASVIFRQKHKFAEKSG